MNNAIPWHKAVGLRFEHYRCTSLERDENVAFRYFRGIGFQDKRLNGGLSNKGGTTLCFISIDGRETMGSHIFHPTESFDYKLGRKIAFSNAFHTVCKKYNTVPY